MVNKKKILCISLSILFNLISFTPAKAETIQIPCGENATYELILPAGVATNGNKCSGELNLDQRVTTLGKNAFQFSKLTSVNLTDSVTRIDSGALSYLNAKTIKLGNKLQYIGFEAFRMSRFTSISLPNSLIEIGECALCDTYFETISIPDSVEIIGANAFSRNDSGIPLRRIEIPNSVKSIGAYAFAFTKLEEVKIGNGISIIPGGAFSYNRIKKVLVPNNVKFIGAFAFKFNPLEEVTISDSVTGIDSEAFASTQIIKLVIPDSVVNIGTKAFADIKTLKSVTFSEKFDSRRSDNSIWVGDIFDGSYAIEEIIYCGKATGFLVQPKCTPEKQALIDSKKVELKQKVLDEISKIDLARISDEYSKNADSADTVELKIKAQEFSKKVSILSQEIKNGKRDVKSSTEDLSEIQYLTQNSSIFNEHYKLLDTRFYACVDRAVLLTQNGRDVESLLFSCANVIKAKNYFQSIVNESDLVLNQLRSLMDRKNSNTAKSPSNISIELPKKTDIKSKFVTISCVNGKLIKKVTAVNPKCPAGYKKK